LDDGRNILQLRLHQLKRSVRISPDAAEDRSGILLGEEALRNHDIQIHVQADRREQEEQHQSAMVERPVESSLVALTQPLELPLECCRQPVWPALPVAPE